MTDSPEGTTLGALFAFAIEAEERTRAIYESLAERFAHLPEVADFWRDLAGDEVRHVTTLQKMRGALSGEQLAAPADPAALAKASAASRRLEAHVVSHIHTLDDAYEMAHDMEFSEINHVFACLADQSVPRGERRDFYFAKLDQHQRKLLTIGERFGDAAWRRTVVAGPPRPGAG